MPKTTQLCPVCEGGYRYPYLFSNDEVVLICEECDCIWLLRHGILFGASGKRLEEILGETTSDLFGGSARWATKGDINALIDEYKKRGENVKHLFFFLSMIDNLEN